MEDGLVLQIRESLVHSCSACLNPCCNGRWSRTYNLLVGATLDVKS